MAQNAILSITNNWTLITDSNVTALTFQNVMPGWDIFVQGTNGTSAPSGDDGIRYASGQGERNVDLADLFPGLTANRVWARVVGVTQGAVFVSHA